MKKAIVIGLITLIPLTVTPPLASARHTCTCGGISYETIYREQGKRF